MKIEIPYSKKLSIREEQISKVLRFNKIPIKEDELLTFDEGLKFGLHSGTNKNMVFKTMLKGSVKIIDSESKFIWNVKTESIIVKTVLLFLFMSFIAYVPLDKELWSALIIGLIFATILFMIVWLNLKGRITRITNQIIQHASNHAKK